MVRKPKSIAEELSYKLSDFPPSPTNFLFYQNNGSNIRTAGGKSDWKWIHKGTQRDKRTDCSVKPSATTTTKTKTQRLKRCCKVVQSLSNMQPTVQQYLLLIPEFVLYVDVRDTSVQRPGVLIPTSLVIIPLKKAFCITTTKTIFTPSLSLFP